MHTNTTWDSKEIKQTQESLKVSLHFFNHVILYQKIFHIFPPTQGLFFISFVLMSEKSINMVIYIKLSLINRVKDSHEADLCSRQKKGLKTEVPLTEEKTNLGRQKQEKEHPTIAHDKEHPTIVQSKQKGRMINMTPL